MVQTSFLTSPNVPACLMTLMKPWEGSGVSTRFPDSSTTPLASSFALITMNATLSLPGTTEGRAPGSATSTELWFSWTLVMARKTYSSVSGVVSSKRERLNDLEVTPSPNTKLPLMGT